MKWRLAVAVAFMVGGIAQLVAGDSIMGIVWLLISVMWFSLAYSRYKSDQTWKAHNELMKKIADYNERWGQ